MFKSNQLSAIYNLAFVAQIAILVGRLLDKFSGYTPILTIVGLFIAIMCVAMAYITILERTFGVDTTINSEDFSHKYDTKKSDYPFFGAFIFMWIRLIEDWGNVIDVVNPDMPLVLPAALVTTLSALAIFYVYRNTRRIKSTADIDVEFDAEGKVKNG